MKWGFRRANTPDLGDDVLNLRLNEAGFAQYALAFTPVAEAKERRRLRKITV